MSDSNVPRSAAERPGRRRRPLAALAAAALVTGSLAAGTPGASAQTARTDVDPQVYAELAADGTTEVIVYLEQPADLSGADRLDRKPAKTEYVYHQLTSAARTSQADLRATLARRGVEHTSFWIANAVLLRGDRALVDELAARADVTSVEPNRTYPLIAPTAAVAAPDPGVAAVEWGISNLNADDVWSEFGATGAGVVVANIDTGVQFDHPALATQYRGAGTGDHDYHWFDAAGVCEDPGVPCDNSGHGTHTMGTMVGDDGADNQIGVAPGAQWIAAKGCESNSCSAAALLASGQWMVAPTRTDGSDPDPAMAPDLVNNSWGGGHGDTWYQGVIDAWVSAGIFPMFAAGNNGPGCDTASSPGDNLPAYAVGAYTINDTIASFSGRGASGVSGTVLKPDASAPGVGVRSAIPTDTYASLSGTSMAAPHASGVVALLWSAVPVLHGDVQATRQILDQTARDAGDTECGGTAADNNVFGEGRLDALAAVTAADLNVDLGLVQPVLSDSRVNKS